MTKEKYIANEVSIMAKENKRGCPYAKVIWWCKYNYPECGLKCSIYEGWKKK